MAINSLDGVISGLAQPIQIIKTGYATQGQLNSLIYAAGFPSGATANTEGISGAALTAYTGQIPFTNPTAGQNTYLGRFSAYVQSTTTSLNGTLFLCDRLWHNSSISLTTLSAQTVNSVTFPPRDVNQSTNGEGIYLGFEISTTMALSATNTLTITYTSSTDTTGSTSVTMTSTQSAGTFRIVPLLSGHTGVKAIGTITHSATGNTGAYSLVAFRIMSSVDYRMGRTNSVDAFTSGFPRMFDNTVPFLLMWHDVSAGVPTLSAQIIYTQG